ncbi:MAG: pyruvate dehydrogenase (acetyl-transferring) E1 component subunit alpha [Myxococcales bacterium]|nr:pyruvate dehydrogenase (acetyl-transferring) E1 component subunit alpha [Myxococcales bacterium]
MPQKEILQFSVSRLEILDAEGNLDADLDPRLPDEKLLALYRGMKVGRAADARMLNLQRQGRIGTFAPCTGQEAVSCAAALAMSENDWFVGAFRELGGRLMRNEPFWQYLVYHNGFEEGNAGHESGRTLPFSVIVAAQTLHAAGVAYAMKYKNEKAAVVVFFGDGATSEGDFHEALNFASVYKLPVVFVCQNNGWAISIPREKQTNSRSLAQKALAYDIPTVQIDGNDALAVYREVRRAIERGYEGQGPSFIEAETYRLLMHTTADDPRKYRTDDEVECAWKNCPLVRFKRYLEDRGIWNDEREAALDESIKQEIDEQVRIFESRRDFKNDALFDNVYSTRHAIIEEQRAMFHENLTLERHNG